MASSSTRRRMRIDVASLSSKKMQILQVGDPAAVARLFLDERDEFASTLASLHQFLNLRAEDAVERLRAVATIKVVPLDGDDVFTTNRKWDAMKERSCLHCENSTAGTRSNKARTWKNSENPAAGCDLGLFRAFVETLEMEHAIVREGNLLRLPAHRVSLGEDRRIAEQITRLLGVNPLAPPDLAQIARDIGIDRGKAHRECASSSANMRSSASRPTFIS